MTRIEAIDLLDNLIGMVDDNHDSNYDTALKMAIKALEFIDKIEPMFGDMLDIPKQEPSGDEWEDGYKRAWAEAEVFFEQEPKTGHWRPIYQGDEIINYRCSECEFGSTFGKSTHGMKYCPNCGTKMVEEQESEDKE